MDATMLLDEYASGRRDFQHAQLEGATLDRAVLPDIDLMGAGLRGASLAGAKLQNVRLDGVDLSGAELLAADLRGASLQQANLRQASLTGARLQGADLRRADLSRTDLTIADLQDASLTGAELAEANLSAAKLAGLDLTLLNLRGASLHTADLRDADCSDSDLTGANLRKANLIGAKFTRARLVSANLTDANLRNAEMTASDLSGADLSGADLTDARLDDAILQDAVRPTIEEDMAVRKLLGVEPAVIRQCRDLEAWLGSHYELALNYPANSLEPAARLRLLQTLWNNPRLAGVARHRDEFGQAWQEPDAAYTESGHHCHGCIRLTPDRVLGWGSLFIDLETPTQLIVYIPLGMLAEVYRVEYPIARHGNPWIPEVDEVLADIAQSLFAAAPFGLGMIGEDSASWWVTEPTSEMLARGYSLLVPEEHYTRLGVPAKGSRSPEGLWWTGGAPS